MKLFKQINEAVELKALQSGFGKAPKSIEAARAVATGEEAVELKDGRTYQAATHKYPGKSLKKGDVVLARYNSINQGVDICRVLGVTDDSEKYGQGGIEFKSVKECLAHYKVKSLAALEALQDQNEYGHSSYLVVEDMEGVEGSKSKRGPWYYLDEGRWVRGSGAEKLSFSKMEEVEEENDFGAEHERRQERLTPGKM